jgi:tetratricopeptide (TPR) repeat protein
MILLALFLLAASPGQPDYERANQLFVAQKFPEALAAVESSLKLDPDLVPALTLKAKLAMAANRYEVARQALEHALAINPKAPYAQFLYGLEAFMNNEMKEALPRFRKARELAPTDPRAALYLGLTVESVGDPQEALSLYQEAVRLEKTKPTADTLLPGVRLLMLLGSLDEAETWARQAVTLAPQLRDAHFELARLLLKKNAAPAAAQEGELALTLAGTTSDTAIHYLLNRAWRQAGDPARAARHAAVIRAQGGR